MFDIALTLKQDEAEALADTVKESIDSLIDFFSAEDVNFISDKAFALSVLVKLYNKLPQKEKDSDATNDTVNSKTHTNTISKKKSPFQFGDVRDFFVIQ